MRIVSEQSTENIRRKKARDALVPKLRGLAANVLRIVKGTGKPLELLRQMESCSAAIREYAAAHDHVPGHELMHQILNCETTRDEFRPWVKESRKALAPLDAEETGREIAIRKIRDACLQLAASILLDQLTQCSKAESDLYEGVLILDGARKRARRNYQPIAKRRR
jgi:hypothetical protein